MFASDFDGFSLLMQLLAFPSRSTCFLAENPNQIIVPTSSNRHMHLPIEFFTRTRLACSRQTSPSTPEIYGSWKVELMFIFFQIAKRNSKWQIWVCLPG